MYWMTVSPDGGYGYEALITTTSGANAIGSPAGNDGNAFVTLLLASYNFTPTTELGYGCGNFSAGVLIDEGASSVPEPGTAALTIGAGLLLVSISRRKRLAPRPSQSGQP